MVPLRVATATTFVVMANPRKLLVLEYAHALFLQVDRAAASIKKGHRGELKRQLMKSAISIPSNIVEGRTKHGQREFLRFLNIALGSTGELEYQVRAAKDCLAIPLATATDLAKRTEQVGKMLQGLIKRIEDDLEDETDGQ